MEDSILEFRGKYYFLSNFYDSTIAVFNTTFENVEAAFQSQKVEDPEEQKKFSELDPSSAKKLGRHVKLRSDWESIKEDVMRKALRAKFTQNKELREQLLGTGNAKLCEGNNWHDNYWGSCYCTRCIGKTHLNRLGTLLTELRDELRESDNKKN